MRKGLQICAALSLLFLLSIVFCGSALAAEELLPDALMELLPQELLQAAEDGGLVEAGAESLWDAVCAELGDVLREGAASAMRILLTLLLCGGVRGFCEGAKTDCSSVVSTVGALCITSLAAGDLNALIGLGSQTIDSLGTLSDLLLPTVSAAVALSGGAATASAWQVGTLLFSNLLLSLIRKVLLPMLYFYIGTVTAAAVLENSSLDGIGDGIRKGIVWTLSTILVVFTAFLTMTNVVSGATDRMAVKAAKLAISNAVPVVGGILSEATETVLAGASALRGTVGVLGVFLVLLLCVSPLLRLGLQYVFYKAAAFLGGAVGTDSLNRLTERLGGAFGILLGMTGSCALLLLVSLFLSLLIAAG